MSIAKADTAGALRGRDALIIGAGVAGLTTAIALARRGASVRILERAPQLTQIGAGLQLTPNAMRVLDALDLDHAVRAASLPSHAVVLCNASGRQVARLDLRKHNDGAFRLIHRAALIEVLAKATIAAGAVLQTGVDGCDAIYADLLIGADGLHSPRRAALNGQKVPFFSGQTAWRAVIEDDPDSPRQAQIFMGPHRHLVSYPLPGGLRNIVAVIERRDWQDEGWSHQGDPQRLRDDFAGFGGPVPDWLGRVGTVHLWGLFRHEVAEVWQDGRQVIIGDAAHPTLPFMAQGANMAIEDAWVLAACLDANPDQGAALAQFQATRAPRVTRIVAAADGNARNYHLTGPKRIAAHAALRLASAAGGGVLLSRYDWIYGFDPTA